MYTRRLGKTGHMSSMIILGGVALGQVEQAEADIAIETAVKIAAKDDMILIAGKGHETYQIIGKTKYDFSDKQTTLDCLKKII